jgi:epoxyqueuosine reductase
MDGSDTLWVVSQAKALGFDLCGVVRAEKFPELAQTEEWLSRGYAGEMSYLADPRRRDPQSLMTAARSIIVCALNYNAPLPKSTEVIAKQDSDEPRGWISRYAWGTDYHEILQEKLRALLEALRCRFPRSFEARLYTDTGPVQERIAAKYAGLGWLGKNTLLLNQKIGSFMFLGSLITSLDLQPTLDSADAPSPDLCGTCRRCIDACPTDAFVEPYVMDARRCVAYLTIEFRGSIPEHLREAMGTHVFGCDICQDVCPWNRRAPETQAPEFQPRSFSISNIKKANAQEASAAGIESLFLPRLEWLAALTQEEFRSFFRGSPVKRAKWRGLVRNACIALGNFNFSDGAAARETSVALLRRLAASEDAVIAESALWAMSRIQRVEGREGR